MRLEQNIALNAKTEKFITAKISGNALKQWFLNSDSQTVVRVPSVVREGLQSGTRDPSVLLNKKNTFCFHLSNSVNKFLNFCVLPLLVLKNGHYSFSQPCRSCRICVKSGLTNFSIEWYWVDWVFLEQGVFKVVRGENTGPTNGTRSEKVWEPLR